MIGKARKGITPIIAVVLLIVIAFVAVGAVGALVTGVIEDVEVGSVGPQIDIVDVQNKTDLSGSSNTVARVRLDGPESLEADYDVFVDSGEGMSQVDGDNATQTVSLTEGETQELWLEFEWPSSNDGVPKDIEVRLTNSESGQEITYSCTITDYQDQVC